MSPILVRPVREQLEHDRIIRLLQAKNRRKYQVGINPGAEQAVPVGTGPAAVFPDLVLASAQRGRRLEAIVEIETGESVNHLEALAQWANFAKLRAPFHLYVPSTMIDVARRLCEDNNIVVNEIWSYHGIGDDMRFALVHRNRETPAAARRPAAAPAPARNAAPKKKKPMAAAKPGKTVKPASRKMVKRPSKPAKRK